jgi:predicted permease
VLRLNPGFTLIAVLSLTLGIGANTALFQLLDAVRLRALPVQKPSELYEIKIVNRESATGSFNGRYPRLTYPQWEQIQAKQQGFSRVLAWSPAFFNLNPSGEARYATGILVSGEFFETLGVNPLLGRLFNAADDRRGCPASGAVISHAFWQREFGGDPAIVGRRLTLSGHGFEIIGVTPPNFFGVEVGRRFDVAAPLCTDAIFRGERSRLDRRDGWWLAALGRLKAGWTPERASAQLAAVSPGIFEATLPTNYTPGSVKNYLQFKLGAVPAPSGFSSLRANYEGPLLLLMGVAGLVLLIACANLANLLLARASAREREVAVRLAIGASRGRIVRQLLAESLLVAALGATLGVLLAPTLSSSLVAFLTTNQDRIFVDLQTDWRVLLFTAAVGCLTSLLFGLTPAFRATRVAPLAAMKAGGRGLTSTRERFSLQRGLVVSQVAVSVVLLFGAFLFARTLQNLMGVELGFNDSGILVMDLDLRRAGVAQERVLEFKRDLLERVRQTPGVSSAANTEIVPLSGSGWNNNILLPTAPGAEPAKHLVDFTAVSPGYFRTLGIRLIAGRDFDQRETRTSQRTVIVNETFVAKVLGGANPLGRVFRVETGPGEGERTYEIVGLVRNTKYRRLREEDRPLAFTADVQYPDPGPDASFIVQSGVPLRDLTASLKRTIMGANPAIIIDFAAYREMIRQTLTQEQLMASLSGFFGFLAAMLAMLGLYGVLSYFVARRRNEIGIRMALGADRGAVLRLVLRDAGIQVGAGLVLGGALAVFAARSAATMLFGLKPADPLTLAMALAALAAVALGASYLPARRAARLEPMTALRDE